MKTIALGLCNLCVACNDHCRYCLLSYKGNDRGVSYERGKRLAERLFAEIGKREDGFHLSYYIGYCNDTPDLPDYIRFCAFHDQPSKKFLQMNGFHFMDDCEIGRLMDETAALGVETMDFTLYGEETYHDRFAGRQGDFALILRMMNSAATRGIKAFVSAPVIKENMDQTQSVLEIAKENGAGDIRFFLPYSMGRGWTIRDQRITQADYDHLSAAVKARFAKSPLKTEAQWIKENKYPAIQSRVLTLVPTAENIDRIERMSFAEILEMLEKMDDEYRRSLPSDEELAKRYGRPDNDQLFRVRDLLLLWRQQFALEHDITAMLDQSHHFSIYQYE